MAKRKRSVIIREIPSEVKVKEVKQVRTDSLEEHIDPTLSTATSSRAVTPTLESSGISEAPAQSERPVASERPQVVREISYDQRNSNYTSTNPQTRDYQDPMAAAGARGTAASATLRTDFEFAGRNELGQIDRQRHSVLDERPEDKQYVGQEEQNNMRVKRRRDWQF